MGIFNFLKKVKQVPKAEQEEIIHYFNKTTSGIENYSGYYNEEYLHSILGDTWADKVDMMIRSSDQLNMLLTLTKNPIIRANWEVTPVDDSLEEEYIADFIKFCLFDSLDFTQFLEEAVSMFEFGHSVFELVYQPLIDHPKWGDAIVPKAFSWISPRTIEQWFLNRDSSLKSLRQCADGDLSVEVIIDSKYLLNFSIGRKGGNHEGISMLRPIYGNWIRKEQLLRIQAMGLERSALGGLILEIPEGRETSQDTVRAIEHVRNFTSHQSNFVALVAGYTTTQIKLEFEGIAVANAIQAEARGMSNSFMAQVMELGTAGAAGSYALSQTLGKIHAESLQVPSDNIANGLNRKPIRNLVDFNFGKRSVYPRIKATGISDSMNDEYIKSIESLTKSGYLKPNKSTSKFVHKRMKLPIEEETLNKIGVQETVNPVSSSIKFSENDGIEFAQTKKKTDKVSRRIKKDSESLADRMKEFLTLRKDKVLDSARKILDDPSVKNKRKAISSLNIPGKKSYESMIFEILVPLASDSKDQVLSEIGMEDFEFAEHSMNDFRNLSTAMKETLKNSIALISTSQDADLSKALFFASSQAIDETDSTNEVIASMESSFNKDSQRNAIRTAAGNAVSSTVNQVRNNVFRDKTIIERAESFTIMNPTPVSKICKELAGRTFSKIVFMNVDKPPFHHNCDSYIRMNVIGRKGNPAINPLELKITGTEDEILAIEKSRTL